MSAAIWVLAVLGHPSLAAAQNQPVPPENYSLDSRGVDLVSGAFNFTTSEVIIGQPGNGGLSYGRAWIRDGWRDTTIGSLTYEASTGEVLVSVGPIAEPFVFDYAANIWVSKYENGSTWQWAAPGVIVTDRYGNRAVFDQSMGNTGEGADNPYGANMGLIAEFTTPSGVVTKYTYQSDTPLCHLGSYCGPIYRLSAITNNFGYMVKYAYASTDPNSSDYYRVTEVQGINLAVDWCDPSATSCSSLTENWPSVTYDTATPPTTSTDQSGRVTTFSYSGGALTSVRYPGATANDITIAYNASPDSRVNAVTDISGAWTYGYSISGTTQTTVANGPLNQQVAVSANLTTGRVTSVAQVTSLSPATSRTWTFQYDSDLRVTQVTQPEGDYVSYAYDSRSNPIQITYVPKPGSSLSNIITLADFPATCSNPVTCNLPITTTNAKGGVTDYSWDATHGGVLSVTEPAPTSGASRPQIRTTYDDFQARYHNSSSTFTNGTAIILPTEGSACATGTSCDGAANEILTTIAWPTPSTPNNLLPVSTSRGSGAAPTMATTTTTYTSDGDIGTVDGPLSGAADMVTYIYDDARQIIGIIGPDPDGSGALLNRARRWTYNGRGLVTSAETGTASGGLWANFSPLVKSQIIYDTAAFFRPTERRQMSAAGAPSSVQQIAYDAAGRPSCAALRMNPSTFSALPSSACTAATAGSFGPDRIVQMSYDAAGQTVSTALGGVAQGLTYTANGRPATLSDGSGNVSIMEYDGFDRMVKLRYPNPTGGGTSTIDYEAWTWNDAGQPLTRRNRAGQITSLTWDLLGRVTEVDEPTGGMDLAFGYDNLGRVLTATGNGQTLTSVWDPLSRLVSETGPLGVMAYQHDAAGRMIRVTWPDATYMTYDRDLYGDLTAVRLSSGVALATYGYNDLGLRTTLGRSNGVNTSWTYNVFGQLGGLSHDAAGPTADVTFGYDWNPAGQIVGRTVSNPIYVYAPVTGTTGYDNDGLNRVTAVGGSGVSYDANQNIAAVTGASYGYDAAGRLISANAGLGSAGFAFDPSGRLFMSTSGGGSTRFVYAGQQLAAEYDDAGTMTRRHVPGAGLDEPLMTYQGAATLFTLADERGSVIGLTDSSGAVSVNRYDEYGVPASGNAGRFQYTGQPWLAEAQAYHYRARTYAPSIGRFLQTDPISYAAGPNLYAYVGADPVNFKDPSGLQSCLTGGYRLVGRYLNSGWWGNAGDIAWSQAFPEYSECSDPTSRFDISATEFGPSSGGQEAPRQCLLDNRRLSYLDGGTRAGDYFSYSERPGSLLDDRSDHWLVGAHGNPSGPATDGAWTPITPGEMARDLNAAGYRRGEPITLFSCRTGQGDFPQALADETGGCVTAPLGYGLAYQDGRRLDSRGQVERSLVGGGNQRSPAGWVTRCPTLRQTPASR